MIEFYMFERLLMLFYNRTEKVKKDYSYLNGESFDNKEGGILMKAVLETGGKQYYVSEGDVIYVEKLDNEAGSEVVFDKVLLVDGVYGNPYVKGASVTGVVEKHGKQKKILVFKYRPKKNSKKTQGHRQPYTKITIKKISK